MNSKDVSDYPDELYDKYHTLRNDIVNFLWDYEPKVTPDQAVNCLSKVLCDLIVLVGKNDGMSDEQVIQVAKTFGNLLEENVILNLE